jgi:hypothetical protein
MFTLGMYYLIYWKFIASISKEKSKCHGTFTLKPIEYGFTHR